jgi:hypothetical protein
LPPSASRLCATRLALRALRIAVVALSLTWLGLMACLPTSGDTPISLAQVEAGPHVDSVNDLWLDVSLGPPLVDWFNRVARPDDIARLENPRQFELLDEIRVGRKLVVFRSVAEAGRFLPGVADRLNIVGYNLEYGPNSPAEELADPVGSVKRMQGVARRYGLLLAFGPDHDLAVSHGVALAPYVDIFVLQVQRVQTEPATVLDFVLPLVKQLRQANRQIAISVQVRSEGNVTAIVDLIDALKEDLDGVSILTSPETVSTAEALVTELRTRTPTPPARATRPAAPVGGGSSTAPAGGPTGSPSRLPALGHWLVALLVGGVAGAWVVLMVVARRRAGDQ